MKKLYSIYKGFFGLLSRQFGETKCPQNKDHCTFKKNTKSRKKTSLKKVKSEKEKFSFRNKLNWVNPIKKRVLFTFMYLNFIFGLRTRQKSVAMGLDVLGDGFDNIFRPHF